MKKRYLALLLSLLLIAALLCGCGSSPASEQAYYSASAADYAYAEEAAFDAYDGAYWANEDVPAAPEPMPMSAEVPAQTNPAKLIYTANLEMETLDFDEALSALAELTAELGGYYESSSVSESGSTRRASCTVRIPAENYRRFLDEAAGDLCHVLSRQEYTEDVSENYYDTSGRLETQRTKLARLQELLAEAEDMADIITVEDAISETEEMIDRLSGTLRHYDALVDYSTVDISLREVKVYEPEPDPTYGSRLGAAFVDGLRGFAEGLGDILIALAYSWLWLLLIAGVVVLILWLTRKRRAARREARSQRKARAAAAAAAPPTYSRPEDAPSDGTEE